VLPDGASYTVMKNGVKEGVDDGKLSATGCDVSHCGIQEAAEAAGRRNLSPAQRSEVNAKRKGTRNEHRSIALLEAAGYACTRAAASLGVFDIVGVGPSDIVLVQCKTRDFPGSVEMETLRNFPCPPGCKKLIHRWRDRQRLPDIRIVEG